MFLSEELKFDTPTITSIASANEVGTIIGGMLIGWISDKCYAKRAPIATFAIVIASVVLMILTSNHTELSKDMLGVFFFVIGITLGGVGQLVCITCTADLG